jgi:hypothetical protein
VPLSEPDLDRMILPSYIPPQPESVRLKAADNLRHIFKGREEECDVILEALGLDVQ